MRLLILAFLLATPLAMPAQMPASPRHPTPHAVIRSAPEVATIPRANRQLLEGSLIRRRTVTGGVIGFVVGAAAGAFVGCLANRDDYGVLCGGQGDTKVLVGAGVGAVVGALVGGRYL